MTKDLEWLKKEAYEKYERMKNNYEITGNNTDNGMLLSAESFIYLIDQVEQAEITHEQALNKLAERYPFSSASIGAILEGHAKHGRYESELPELPVIPQFVAEYIEERKNDLEGLYGSMRYIAKYGWDDKEHRGYKVFAWLGSGNDEKFARAWLDGYTVKEKKYYVFDNNGRLLLKKTSLGITELTIGTMALDSEWFEPEKYALTEREIKDYDERYWAFREPVDS